MRNSRAARAARFILVVTALVLPSLSLLPLGGLYLWEKGYLLWWALASTVAVTTVFLAQRWLLTRPEISDASPSSAAVDETSGAKPNPAWSPAERRAWDDVKIMATRVEVDKLTDAKTVFELGHRTVNAVARRIHPEKSDALWQFTMPEALAISERVSQRLGGFIERNIPFGDRLTVSQVMTVYSWRSIADVAERAYDIWRIIRLANPATAITNEARERLSRAMLSWGKEHVTRRLAERFVLEVGRAAIDLYGGRLKVTEDDVLANRITPSSLAEQSFPHQAFAFRVTVAGSDDTLLIRTVSSLFSIQQARAEAIAAVVRGEKFHSELARIAPIEVRQTKARGQSPRDAKIIAGEAERSDILIWVRSGTGPLTDFERLALRTAGHNETKIPAVLLPVVYMVSADPAGPIGPVANDRQTVVHDTEADWFVNAKSVFAAEAGNPVVIETIANSADASSALLAAIGFVLEPARRVQLARQVEALKSRRNWGGTARRAVSAVGSLARALIGDRPSKL